MKSNSIEIKVELDQVKIFDSYHEINTGSTTDAFLLRCYQADTGGLSPIYIIDNNIIS